MRAAPRGNKQLVAARPGTGRFFQSPGWALTLALGLGGLFSGCRLPSLAHSLPIATTLAATALPARFRLPPGLSGAPSTPPPCRLLTPPTAIPCLRTAGLKELLASLQQAATPPRLPARALPRTRFSIMLKRTQGSVNSRRSSLGEEPNSSPRHLTRTALSLDLPPHQSSRARRWPPHRRRPTAANHRRPSAQLAGEMAQSPAAANIMISLLLSGTHHSHHTHHIHHRHWAVDVDVVTGSDAGGRVGRSGDGVMGSRVRHRSRTHLRS